MADGRAAIGFDRLPWLEDEPQPRAKPRERAHASWVALAVAGTALVAGVSYWMGMKSWEPEPAAVQAPPPARPSTTVTVPQPRMPATPQVSLPQVPEVRPAPAPTVEMPVERVERRAERRRSATAPRRKRLSPMDTERSELKKTVAKQTGREQAAAARAAAVPVARTAPARAQPLRLWPARERRGAYGRVVQIGAFGSRHQAKLGWRYMARAYPGVRRLPAVVVEARNSRGRRFYRFQIGTTSQAHSEVLCQRMQRIRFSCAVVGLPWKSKVER